MNKVQRKKIIMIKSEKTSMIMIVMITTMMIKMSVMPIKREIKIITNFRKHYKEEKNSYVVTESSRAHHRVVVITNKKWDAGIQQCKNRRRESESNKKSRK